MTVDPKKVRLHIEEVGDAEVVGAFLDPRSKRWAYRVRLLGDFIDGDPKKGKTRIIYPDQIERLEWSVRGEMELLDVSSDGTRSQASPAASTPVLLGGGSASLGSRIVQSRSFGNNMSSHAHPYSDA